MKKIFKQPEGHKAGIYFDMPEEVYHGDPALSHSGMKNILKHPFTYWYYSVLNPDHKPKKTSSMDFGTLTHMYLMQPEKFFEVYTIPGMGYFPNKKIISRTDFRDVEESVQMIKDEKKAYQYFQNGFAEVSIFWPCARTGIMLKIRVDYLRTFGGIDLKRAKNIENNPLGWAISDYGYDMQSELYKEGIKQIKMLLRKKKASSYNCPDLSWLKKFISDEDNMMVLFFQCSQRPYVFRIIEFEKEIADNSRFRIECAIDKYNENIAKYGTNKWPAGSPEIEEFSIYHLPRKIFDQGA